MADEVYLIFVGAGVGLLGITSYYIIGIYQEQIAKNRHLRDINENLTTLNKNLERLVEKKKINT